jgi:secreted trypsin-like serine protease
MNSLFLAIISLLALSAAARPAPVERRALITNGNGVDGSTLGQYGAKMQGCIVDAGCSTFCSAVLVGPRVALTAAHCAELGDNFTSTHENSFVALLFENADGATERIVVGSSHFPPEYATTPLGQFDIAVLALKSVASVGPVTSIVDAAALVTSESIIDEDTDVAFEAAKLVPTDADMTFFAVGAGLEKPGVTVPVDETPTEALAKQTTESDFPSGLPNVARYNAWTAPNLLGGNGALAARAVDPEHVVCFVDSGSPLLALGTGGEISVVAIATETIFGKDRSCGRYSVYTSVVYYKQFIDGVTSALGPDFSAVYV